MKKKPVLAIDFDGTLRLDERTVTPGALEAVREYLKYFQVNVYAARSARPGGPDEMRNWLKRKGFPVTRMKFPRGKPAIHALIDDQAFRFEGIWPTAEDIMDSEGWSKKRNIGDTCRWCGGDGQVFDEEGGTTTSNCGDCERRVRERIVRNW